MEERAQELIRQLEQDVLNGDVPIQDALRKVVILGGCSGSSELREWANKELRGYGPEDDVPEYRTLGASLRIDAIVGPRIVRSQPIDPSALPEPIRDQIAESVTLRMPIAEIEKTARDAEGDVHLTFGNSVAVAELMNRENGDPYQQIISIYWRVSRSSMAAIGDQVRTVLAEFVAELSQSMPPGQEIPSAQQANHAFHVAVTGDRAQISIQAPTTSGGTTSTIQSTEQNANENSPEEDPPLWRRLRRPGVILIGIATIVGTIASLGQWLKW
ncbi:hypothetical protein Acsp04_64760 [Actinomadura sp. NBRC 104425]|uniref:AbiTii domain-containing protein n=1 Tax=Actinomadura sp. NBRC 104425 TaxID=3032204 RepID=UPI0024A1CF8B|nr:hypothetical protein [Actinomadura sp. NBRC 104425]GLZ16241.1 hypothetical protein Acsp04_64760 [Actinomadura sp. NBRC 104425]